MKNTVKLNKKPKVEPEYKKGDLFHYHSQPNEIYLLSDIRGNFCLICLENGSDWNGLDSYDDIKKEIGKYFVKIEKGEKIEIIAG